MNAKAVFFTVAVVCSAVGIVLAVPGPQSPQNSISNTAGKANTFAIYAPVQNHRNSSYSVQEAPDRETAAAATAATPAPEHIDFAPVPATEQNTSERNVRVARVESPWSKNRVRIEVYMGEQTTAGYHVEISDIVRRGNHVNVHAVFQHPMPDESVTEQTTYPSDAAEFDLPPGDYTVNLHIEELQHRRFSV